ncbi:MAG: C4-dicarboxylate ABC transporter permease [Desulfobacteraceae bacterium 4572_89]|nr:MAG: C4-dicarboxylate ABC transporter permease [Desulfobacteraceae bacterium 4572_89]
MFNKTGFFNSLSLILQKIEDYILVSLLLTMITMAVLQIFLRNFFDSGIVWGDSLVRVLVLWIGLIGAMVASRTDNHISIDIISRFLPPKIKRFTTLAVHLFTAVVTAAMSWFSMQFVAMEMADNMTAFASIPAWVCEIIIPIAFAVISVRYTLFSINHIIQIISPQP